MAAIQQGAPLMTVDYDFWVHLPERQYVRLLAIVQRQKSVILAPTLYELSSTRPPVETQKLAKVTKRGPRSLPMPPELGRPKGLSSSTRKQAQWHTPEPRGRKMGAERCWGVILPALKPLLWSDHNHRLQEELPPVEPEFGSCFTEGLSTKNVERHVRRD